MTLKLERRYLLILDLLAGVFGLFYLLPLAIGMWILPNDVLRFTQYDAAAATLLTMYFAIRMLSRLTEIGKS